MDEEERGFAVCGVGIVAGGVDGGVGGAADGDVGVVEGDVTRCMASEVDLEDYGAGRGGGDGEAHV